VEIQNAWEVYVCLYGITYHLLVWRLEITVKIKILKYAVFNIIMILTNCVFWLCIDHPQGTLKIFVTNVELVLQKPFLLKFTFIICGDINMNCLVDSYKKKQLDSILNSFNLCSIVNFPTRIGPSSLSNIDNVLLITHI